MKQFLLSLLAIFATVTVCAQTAEFFEPYKTSDLRLPSVPIITNDTYFSIWSPYDSLTAGPTRHWTDEDKPIDGLLRVDGTTYRFMGVERSYILNSILPMADEGAWTAPTSHTTPDDGWAALDFDDSSWTEEKGAFGTKNEYPNVYTSWTDTNSDIYVRRTVTLTADDIADDLYIVYSHDDVFELYINGTKVIDTGETWLQGEVLHLTDTHKALLQEGDNVIAAHCHNTTGGALLDYGLYRNIKTEKADIAIAKQLSVNVMPTSTYYSFECGSVKLDLVFTAPMLMDDLDLLSTPINYISYQVTSTDGNAHDVQLYLATSPELAINESTQTTISTYTTSDDFSYIRTGTKSQNVLGTKGDGVCIDWGYLYLPGVNGEISLTSPLTAEAVFASTGKLSDTEESIEGNTTVNPATLAYTHDFGSVTEGRSFAMLGYDEVYDMRYMARKYKGYWARDGKTILQAFTELRDNYTDIMTRCRALDKQIYDDGLAAGNQKYAELLCASYRQAIAAHKLFEDKDGNLLFFSKENNSGGFVNTVDVTYPSTPLFLLYNPDLCKGMITSIFEYSKSGKWTKPYAAHDLGTYPVATGQTYGGDMPLEESGNMIILAAMVSKIEGNTDYAEKYWDIIQTWTDYLVENGQDPAEQLCTDDFAGHWAHNANLSIKAIMGIAGFAEMARMKGDTATADTYLQKAKEMARIWVATDREDNHYRLAYDREGSWSQKYNLVWDKMWNLHLFPGNAAERELQYYKTKQNKYGLPLDSRSDYSKSDWIIWTASMAQDNETFLKFSDLVWKYVNETTTRVPLCDWFYTSAGTRSGFKARSVVGGHWMKVLMDKYGTVASLELEWAPVEGKMDTPWTSDVTVENAHAEYPRPQMVRTDWQNLNGLWDYGFTSSTSGTAPSLMDGKILVPFAKESSLSGVMQPADTLNAMWYQRDFTIPEEWDGKKVILNIGACDFNTRVYINGSRLGTHNGGFSAFSYDITKYLTTDSANTITVKVVDENSLTKYPLGKQRTDGGSDGSKWHSSVTGLWQTVWLEPVNSKYISGIKVTPDVDNSCLTVIATTSGTASSDVVKVVLKDGGETVAEGSGSPSDEIKLSIASPKLWSPQSPFLYDMQLTLLSDGEECDQVSSYAALRKISVAQDGDGIKRLQLNNQDLFQVGVIDQGYWPDGLYTAPTDEALRFDIQKAKDLGYNTIRKHQKVEPERWYYYCDSIGMLVWQDMPDFGVQGETLVADDWFTGTSYTSTTTARRYFNNEWEDVIGQLYNHPSVVVLTPFDEAQGQFNTSATASTTAELDPTRLVDAASGGNHYEGVGDLVDIHDTTDAPSIFLSDSERPTVMGLFGSLIYNVEGYRWDEDYTTTTYSDSETFTNAYTTLASKVAALAKASDGKALSAAVYGQLYDVETEHSGLMTYDRRLVKIDEEKAKEANTILANVLDDATGIDNMNGGEASAVEVMRYNLSGQRVGKTAKGVSIVRYSDGTARKVIVK